MLPSQRNTGLKQQQRSSYPFIMTAELLCSQPPALQLCARQLCCLSNHVCLRSLTSIISFTLFFCLAICCYLQSDDERDKLTGAPHNILKYLAIGRLAPYDPVSRSYKEEKHQVLAYSAAPAEEHAKMVRSKQLLQLLTASQCLRSLLCVRSARCSVHSAEPTISLLQLLRAGYLCLYSTRTT